MTIGEINCLGKLSFLQSLAHCFTLFSLLSLGILSLLHSLVYCLFYSLWDTVSVTLYGRLSLLNSSVDGLL